MDKLRHCLCSSLIICAALATSAAHAAPGEISRWQAQAARVTITRDDWGIAHVVGKTDADAVFGMIYAQAEDDFGRIEANYLTALGRRAEAEGESAIWSDLRQRLYVDPFDLRARYAASPAWLRKLMTAWSDGLNFYLSAHPDVRPKVLTRFEPWMALAFTEGSIGGDIERISLSELASFYGGARVAPTEVELGMIPREPVGSNGIAIAPKNTSRGHALLLINPHTSFFFRSELQMTSAQGLNAYGAATWGQFFVYQGFNDKIGWMHTSSGVDNVDEFAETIVRNGDQISYRYGKMLRPFAQTAITIAFRRPDGTTGQRSFTTYSSHHGPIVAERDGKWIAEALMWKPVPALEQSWLRTKTSDLASYLKVAARQANSSNATLIADAKGTIAYLHPQFVPIRNDRFDYTRAVDGSDPATDWKGLHAVSTLPSVANPKVGWVYNANDWPWEAAGPDSPKAKDYPRYMDEAGPNARGPHAHLVLKGQRDFTVDKLREAAFDSYLPAFATLIPQLTSAFDQLPASDPQRLKLSGPIALLRAWDFRWAAESQATTLAVFWGDGLWREVGALAKTKRLSVPDYITTRVTPAVKLAALTTAVDRLSRDFGDWRIAWGRINRFQRLDNAIIPHFDDTKPSVAVPFTSAQWGSLASFGAKAWPGTRNYYGTSGNSFVAVVEFGPRVHAQAVTAGGESGAPASKHFNDQAERYATGKLRQVYFYPDELVGHVEERYRPGDMGRH
jgi:acyl-homoserine-lactone acylase